MPSSRREFMKAAALTGALAVSGRLLEGEAGAATPPIDKEGSSQKTANKAR